MPLQYQQKGFTLIELLVVISIIGVLSTIAMTSVNAARKKARDAERLSDMSQILNALEIYRLSYGHYPYNTDSTLPLDAAHPLSDNYGGWDMGYFGGVGSGDTFIKPLVDAGLMNPVPGDSLGSTSANTYRYYRYGAGSGGCDINRGAFFVLGITDLETSARPYIKSPGWRCTTNWNTGFDWVTGGFEN